MALIVQKYGGSSVADAEGMNRVAKRVTDTAKEGNQVVVVVSAMGDTTDNLIALAAEVTKNPSDREMDMLLSTGEQQSIAILTMAIHEKGFGAISLTGEQAGVKTDDSHSKAKILAVEAKRVKEELNKGNIVIVAGFQGTDKYGDIQTLGRGGSDTSAVALAIGLDADYCEIFTDVDGVYTADPRVVPNAIKLEEVSFDEMLEMAILGAGILQPRSVEIAMLNNMPIHVRSSFNNNEGTMVKEASEVNKLEKDMVVSGVAADEDVVKVTLFNLNDKPGVAGDIFGLLADSNINIDMIIQSGEKDGRTNISFTTAISDLNKVKQTVDKINEKVGFSDFDIEENVAKVSIVGAGMISNPGIAAKMFKVLATKDINIDMISTSEIKVSCVIAGDEADNAVKALHEAFIIMEKENK